MIDKLAQAAAKKLSLYLKDRITQERFQSFSMVLDASVTPDDVSGIEEDLDTGSFPHRWIKDRAMLMRHRGLFDSRWGLYLEDMDNVWIRDRQEYYEKIFEKGCMLLGTECMEQGDYEAAAGYLKNALSVSCYSEKTMGMLLQCYSRAGEPGYAKKQYEEFCSLLKRELDIEPGEELRAEYRAFRLSH